MPLNVFLTPFGFGWCSLAQKAIHHMQPGSSIINVSGSCLVSSQLHSKHEPCIPVCFEGAGFSFYV